jgi:hypothetical protein
MVPLKRCGSEGDMARIEHHCFTLFGLAICEISEELYSSHEGRKRHQKWKLPLESNWDYGAFELLVQEEILDSCECGCSSSGCDFLTCFWKGIFADALWFQTPFPAICDGFEDANPTRKVKRVATSTIWKRQHEGGPNLLLELTVWVDKAANTLQLRRLVYGYMRLFVFSYLELTHTCCAIGNVEHKDNPDYDEQPHRGYSPKEEICIKNEDARLRDILEKLVPMFICQFDAVGGRLLDFVVDVMIPKMRKVVKEIRRVARKLREEEKALYAEGRRELGVVMYEDEDDAEQSDSDEEEEGEEWYAEEESDDEY